MDGFWIISSRIDNIRNNQSKVFQFCFFFSLVCLLRFLLLSCFYFEIKPLNSPKWTITLSKHHNHSIYDNHKRPIQAIQKFQSKLKHIFFWFQKMCSFFRFHAHSRNLKFTEKKHRKSIWQRNRFELINKTLFWRTSIKMLKWFNLFAFGRFWRVWS